MAWGGAGQEGWIVWVQEDVESPLVNDLAQNRGPVRKWYVYFAS